MSGFLPKEPSTFINIKLTDTGRRLLSLGALRFEKAAFSDREIDYSIARTGQFNMGNSRVLAPKDDEPTFANLDGSDFITLGGQQVSSVKQNATAFTQSVGFFSGSTNAYAYDPLDQIGKVRISYSAATGSASGGTSIGYETSSATPEAGMLLYVPWEPILNSGKTYVDDTIIASANPTNNLWYRITSADTGNNVLFLDRPTPDFANTLTDQSINAYLYPFNGVENYYGSAATVNTSVWNMNIVRTSSEIGTDSTISGYTTYGSIEFAGTKAYLGFSSDTRDVGIIHYTNEFTGNTYAEQLIEGTVELEIPNIMWHGTTADAGKAMTLGMTLYDVAGDSIFDGASNTSYKDLRDGTSTGNKIVGRVYHKLKMFVITDPELLNALTYKSNRSYTLPEPEVRFTSSPKYPLSTSEANGLVKSGKTYFVTYEVDSERTYSSGVTYGYPKPIHSNYIQQIAGETDRNGEEQYLVLDFPRNSFPYMRSSEGMTTYSGTGWNANSVQVLIKETDESLGYDIGSVPSDGWVRISSGSSGNGIYTGETADNTIDPLKIQGYQFVVSQEDYNSGTTFTLSSGFTQNNNIANSGLTFGNESFFFGNVSAGIKATAFKTIITVLADNTRFNSSNNPTFAPLEDQSVYITEVGIFNENNDLVATGKPTYPLRKDNGRFLGVQLELDF